MLHPINWSLALPYYLAALAFGYLVGSIPFGVILTRLAGTADLRAIGPVDHEHDRGGPANAVQVPGGDPGLGELLRRDPRVRARPRPVGD